MTYIIGLKGCTFLTGLGFIIAIVSSFKSVELQFSRASYDKLSYYLPTLIFSQIL